jgi:excisionase family DNA binding protein
MSESSIFDQGNLTVRQASAQSSLRRSTLYVAMDAGKLAYIKVGAARRIPKRALIRFLEQHLISGQAARQEEGALPSAARNAA